MRVSAAARNAWLETLNTLIGSGGKLKVYTGSIPASPETGATGTLLVTFNLANPPVVVPGVGGSINFSAISSVATGASGTVGYARFETSGGVGVLDCPGSEITTPAGSGGTVSAGTTVSVTSASASVPLGS